MRRKINEHYLSSLNRRAVFVKFEDTTWHNENTDSAEADYFGEVINVSFPNAGKRIVGDEECFTMFYLTLYRIDEQNCYEKIPYDPFEMEFETIAEVIGAVNAYIRSRPFMIRWEGRGKYLLLDPNGANYTGEYVTLKDAKRTSRYNYELNF